MLVMEKIIEYLVGCPRNSFDANMDRHNTKKGILVPLLSIGEFWREAVLVSICDNCAISFNNKSGGFKVAFPAWPAAFSYPRFRKGYLVKRVIVAVPHLIDMVNGRYDESSPAYSVKNERITLGSMSISRLTRLIQQANMASAPFAMLAYRNAGTLRELRIRTGTQANWRALIYGASRTPTVYSMLTSFILGIGNISSSASWAAISNAEPFPALSALEISEDYPFVDDLLFRGNGATLKNLRLPFCVIKRNVLGKFGILGRSGVRQMNTVIVGLPPASAKTFSPTRVDTTDLQVYNAVRTAPGTATLQHLEITTANFDAKQIIEIVSALPNLVNLTCRTLGIGADLTSIPEDELPGTIHAIHYPLSTKFRRL
ncbi:hypothetical protein GGH94_004005 [Coemansia aciculifera]|uniref:Uncharacterized protein n=1 Tax=Coemansia aciculifera TaxID=417176 RepID=A0A9W8M3Z5_9FUNG|nr:hypothetical protein GGH94_004005 [Coemansia aciculifera]